MSDDPKTKAAAFTLFNQCRNVLVLKGERKDSHDAYSSFPPFAVGVDGETEM